MVIEYIRCRVPLDRDEEFERNCSEAQQVLRDAPGSEVRRGVEEPENHLVRTEGTSVQEDEQRLRDSAAFGELFEAVRPFFARIEEMRHYPPASIGGGR